MKRAPEEDGKVATLNRKLSTVEAFEILKRMDVDDAMCFVTYGDKRYAKMSKVMETDLIWEYWAMRDMPEMIRMRWDVKWKTVYLWLRLACCVYQKMVVGLYTNATNSRIGKGRQPFERVSIKKFNVIDVNGTEVNFRNVFKRLMKYIYDDDDEYMIYFSGIEDLELSEVRDFLTTTSIDPDQIDEYARSVYGILNGENNVTEIMRSIPRVLNEKILVCASCKTQYPSKMCSCPCAMPYCDASCQANHHPKSI